MTVQVYLNVHKTKKTGRPIYSVRDKKTRKVIQHAGAVLLEDARFVVSEAGRQRVLRENRKNVHAFVEGKMTEFIELPDEYGTRVTYNPYLYDSFVALDNETPVHGARAVFLGLKVWAWEVVE